MNRLIISDNSAILKSQLNKYISEAIEEKNDFNYLTFDFESNPLDEILEALESPSMFGEKKVVLCKNPYFINGSKIKLPFENDITLLEKYLENPNELSDLIIICPKNYFNAKSKFISKFTSTGGEVENLLFDKENDFNAYGLNLIRRSQINIDDDAIDLLFKRCFDDVGKLEKEIAKLYLYGEYVDLETVKKFVPRPLEEDMFLLSNAILANNKKDTMRIYYDLKLTKVEPITLISMLANQFRLILQCSVLSKKMSQEEIASKLSVHPYRVKLAINNSYNFPISVIKDNLIALADLDRKIKTGEADRYIDFELFLASK